MATLGATARQTSRLPTSTLWPRDGIRLTDFYANGATCSPTRYGSHLGTVSAAVCDWRRRLAREHSRDAERGLPATGEIAAATAEEQRLRNRAHRQVAPGIEAGVQPWRSRIRLFLRLQERLHRLLPAHAGRFAVKAGPVRERPSGGGGRLHDGSDYRAVRPIHRTERTAAVLHRCRVQRCALAVPAAGQAVHGHDNAQAPRAVRQSDTSTRADYVAMLERADQGVGRILQALDRLGLTTEHDRDLHQRQRRRMAVAQHAALSPQRDGVGRRDSRAGDSPLAGTHSGWPRLGLKSESRWT